MKVLTIVSHPRKDSLTFQAAGRFVHGLRDAGHEYEILDLHAIGFDPVLQGADEPDLSAGKQIFSEQVELGNKADEGARRVGTCLSRLVVASAGHAEGLHRPGMEQRVRLWRRPPASPACVMDGTGGCHTRADAETQL